VLGASVRRSMAQAASSSNAYVSAPGIPLHDLKGMSFSSNFEVEVRNAVRVRSVASRPDTDEPWRLAGRLEMTMARSLGNAFPDLYSSEGTRISRTAISAGPDARRVPRKFFYAELA
jgi:hypothetical protein